MVTAGAHADGSVRSVVWDSWRRCMNVGVDPGIKVRTIVDGLGGPHARTPDGWPAHEPWRGAAIHAQESGAVDAVVIQALDRLLPNDDAG